MTIQLPSDVENSVLAEVHRGQFASVDDALAEAWRQFQRRQHSPVPKAVDSEDFDPILGLMSDHVELMDQIVEDAMRNREHHPWRLNPGE